MALTAQQLSEIEYTQTLDLARNASVVATQKKNHKLELVRLARDVLIENARSKPADSRDVSAEDIIAFADTLVDYVDA
jgi:hypothetical protein